MRAIISVSDKTGAVEFAAGLVKLGYELFSTGGIRKALVEVRRRWRASRKSPASRRFWTKG